MVVVSASEEFKDSYFNGKCLNYGFVVRRFFLTTIMFFDCQ